MARGTVRFVSERGSGYIRCEDSTDIFFCRPDSHGSDSLSLKEGQVVEFLVTQGPRGRHAEHVALVTQADLS